MVRLYHRKAISVVATKFESQKYKNWTGGHGRGGERRGRGGPSNQPHNRRTTGIPHDFSYGNELISSYSKLDMLAYIYLRTK